MNQSALAVACKRGLAIPHTSLAVRTSIGNSFEGDVKSARSAYTDTVSALHRAMLSRAVQLTANEPRPAFLRKEQTSSDSQCWQRYTRGNLTRITSSVEH